MRKSCLFLVVILYAGSSHSLRALEAVGAPSDRSVTTAQAAAAAADVQELAAKRGTLTADELSKAVDAADKLGVQMRTESVRNALQGDDPKARAKLLAAAQKQEEPELKPLQLGTSLLITPGGASTGLAPLIEAYGAIGDPSKPFFGDLKLSIKGLVASSEDAASLADAIRLDAGTISLNSGFVWKHFSANEASSPLGVDFRAAVQASYQKVPTGDSGAEDTRHDFAIVAPEVRLAAWLKYAYVGYKWNYSWTFGKSSDVADEIDRSSTHKVFVAVRLGNPKPNEGDFYIEGQYTGGRNTLQSGTFSLAITRTFNSSW